jgi:diaminopimelate decarboxylase
MNNYKWYYHLISASRAIEDTDADYKVAGPLCDSGDVYFDIERGGRLPDYRRLPKDVKPGEVLALLNSGAYSLAQMFPYNGRPLPAAVLVRDGGLVTLVRRRDTYEDLITNDIW